MKKIRLELESFRILKNRERWRIYFIVYTTHPQNPDKTIIKFVPGSGNIRLKPLADNYHSFKPTGKGTDGLRLLHIEIPESRYMDVRMVMMQSRKKMRSLAAKMSEIKKDLDIKEMNLIKLSRIHWYAIDKGFNVVAGILQNIQDRNMGFVNMDEEFEEEFEKNPNQKRSQKLSTGEAEINWVWELKE